MRAGRRWELRSGGICGALGGLKQPFGLKDQCCAFSI